MGYAGPQDPERLRGVVQPEEPGPLGCALRVDGIVGNSKRGRHSTALAEASAEQAFWKSTEHMFL